jgi:amidase
VSTAYAGKIIPIEGKYIYKSASELSAMIKRGEASSVDIVKEHINHIKNNNWRYNAVVWLREEDALKEAEMADLAVARGDTSPPLLGVPMTVKEQFWVKGLPATLNAKRFGLVAPEDAGVVKQIKKAGAIILGTTNLSFMVAYNETYGEVYPTANNPYDTNLTPGGSTGGEAAALAAGFTPLSLGADAGGSIRIPASFCGVFGFKPSFGSINVTQGVMPFEVMDIQKFGLAVAGPLARTPEDLELLWQVLIKTPVDSRFQKNIKFNETQKKQINQYKIAWIDEWDRGAKSVRIGRDVKNKLNCLLDTLKNHGVSLKKDAPQIFDEMLEVWGGSLIQITTQNESWLVRKMMKLVFSKQDNGDIVYDAINKSLDDNSHERWNELQKKQEAVVSKVNNFFKNYDFFVLPLTYGPAFIKCGGCKDLPDLEGGKINYNEYFSYTGIFNASGNPAIVVPMGLNDEGLPIGIQIVAPINSDADLLYFVQLISPLIPGFQKPKSVFSINSQQEISENSEPSMAKSQLTAANRRNL